MTVKAICMFAHGENKARKEISKQLEKSGEKIPEKSNEISKSANPIEANVRETTNIVYILVRI